MSKKNPTLIKSLYVRDFMSFEECKVEFDETNILTLKGYNNSGKSALVKAFEVCLLGKYENKQGSFIRDGQHSFHIEVKFTDGIVIRREKYANGQSLYEMVQNGETVFTTRQGRVLGKLQGVPDAIKAYVGATEMDEGWLNTANGNEPLLLTDTTGGENFRAISDVLKAEELHKAMTAVRTDLKTNQEELNYLRARREKVKEEIGGLPEKEKIGYLKENIEAMNGEIGSEVELTADMYRISVSGKGAEAIRPVPRIGVLDCSVWRSVVGTLVEGQKAVEMRPVFVKTVDSGEMKNLREVEALLGVARALEGLETGNHSRFVEVPLVEGSGILKGIEALKTLSDSLLGTEENLRELKKKLRKTQTQVNNLVLKIGKDNLHLCTHCGRMGLNGLENCSK